jgi:hypothetical protein
MEALGSRLAFVGPGRERLPDFKAVCRIQVGMEWNSIAPERAVRLPFFLQACEMFYVLDLKHPVYPSHACLNPKLGKYPNEAAQCPRHKNNIMVLMWYLQPPSVSLAS